jgi:hypothetical protein
MTADEYKALIAEDEALAVGDRVWFRFTNNGRYRRVMVRLVKINAKSLIGEVIARYEPESGFTYPAGQRLKVPRISDIKQWTANNRCEPAEQFEGIDYPSQTI